MFLRLVYVISCFSAIVYSFQLWNVRTGDKYVSFGNQGRRRREVVNATLNQKVCINDKLDNEAKRKIKKNSYPLKDDSNFDLQLVWLGENSETQFLLTTTDLHTLFMLTHKPSRLYQSDDMGFTYENVQQKIDDNEIRSKFGIMKSPLNSNKLIFISYESKSTLGGIFGAFMNSFQTNSSLIITENGGKNFSIVMLPFVLRENEPLLFCPQNENWIIALEKATAVINMITHKKKVHGEAWISKDFGKTWNIMMKGLIAQSVKWGAAKEQGAEIYISTDKESSSFSFFKSSAKLTLWKSSDGGKFFEEIVEQCINFGVQGNFIFASVLFEADHKDIRKMYVSKDSGKHFRPVNLPEISPEKFYAVVEMFKDMIFLHVDEAGDTGKGTLYISDADGLTYTKSLDNHFYTNNGFTDFYNIESMPGVYITQKLDQDNTLKSVITYDRGVIWQPIKLDADYCKDMKGECTLHFHNEYSKTKGVVAPAPLSSKNAPGIVFMHGQQGDGLTGVADVWLSINGGYDWKKIAKGPHFYAIGDMGNLLVIYPMVNSTGNKLKYSIDMGRCWNEYQFIDKNDEVTVRGLITEPHSQDRVFSLWGYLKSKETKEWLVITVNFHEMFSRQCTSGDFEEWYPHSPNDKDGCLLGEKTVYRRPLLDADCYLGKNFEPFLKSSKCQCTNDDLECDYGYDRTADGTCKKNSNIKSIEVCKDGEEEQQRFSKGYRRVPGDNCKSENAIEDIVKYIDESKKCVPSKQDYEGVLKLEKKFRDKLQNEEKLKHEKEEEDERKEAIAHANREKELEKETKQKSKKHSNAFAIVGLVFISFAFVLVILWFVRRQHRRRYMKASLKMSKLQNDAESDEEILNNGFDSRPKSLRPFKDESDVEDEAMLPV